MKRRIAFIRSQAHRMGLDDDLAVALCSSLSNFDPLKKTHNPEWKMIISLDEVKKKNHNFDLDDEITNQKTRYGVFQLYGAIARGMNFFRPLYLLLDDEINTELGLKYLKFLTDKYENESFVISAFLGNGVANKLTFGFNNQKGVDVVLNRLRLLRSLNTKE